LFEPFSQADETLDRSKGGLGLGLALVKGLVELHGGDVAAYSEGPGHGAEFVIRFPLEYPAAAQPEAPCQSPEHRSRRVLIIEDNVDAANSLSEVLGLAHHQVAVAYNGPDGIARAREFQPEVVLCDIGLPGMDGYKVARAFRATPALHDIYLVALTGYALPEDLQQAQQAGFQRHLAKPPSLDTLESLLDHLPASGGEQAGTAAPK
jgi:two-component system CheB/CheR fusion protein